MNSKLTAAALLVLMACNTASAGRVETRNAWTEHYPVTAANPTLEISNIWGDVQVRSGKPGEITVSIKEHRSAPDQHRLERSLETLKLNIGHGDNGVALYVGNRSGNWHGDNPCRGCRVDYQFEVTVPANTRLDVSTVNDGRVDIAGVSGRISAGNVNGPIAISDLTNCAELNNVNGAVNLSFSTAPAENCAIETINGDVTLKLPPGSGIDVAMELFNGRMLTQLPAKALDIPARVEHTESQGRHQYRIEQPAGVRIGAGGPVFTISSMNGDIRIQKIN